MTEKEINAMLGKTGTAMYTIQQYPLSKIVEFLNACNTANHRLPISARLQTIITRSATPFANVIAANTLKSTDLLTGSSDVVIFNAVRKEFYKELADIKGEVQHVLPRNKAVLVSLNLDKVSDYYQYSQADLLQALVNMEVNAAKEPALVAGVLPMITALKLEVENPLMSKRLQFINIEGDRRGLPKILKALRVCLIANFGAFQEEFCDDLEKIFDYLPISILFTNVHAKGYLKVNQELIESPSTRIVFISKLPTTKSSIIKGENFDSKPFRLWRSVGVATVCPPNAFTINGNSLDTCEALDIGTNDATCLMCEFDLPLNSVKAKFTVTQRKRSRKI